MNKIKITPEQEQEWLKKYPVLPSNVVVGEPEKPKTAAQVLAERKALATINVNEGRGTAQDSLYAGIKKPEAPPKPRSYTEARGQYRKQIEDSTTDLNKTKKSIDSEGYEVDVPVYPEGTPMNRELKRNVSTYSDSLNIAAASERAGVPNMDEAIQIMQQHENALREFSTRISYFTRQGLSPQEAILAARKWFQKQNNGATVEQSEARLRELRGR